MQQCRDKGLPIKCRKWIINLWCRLNPPRVLASTRLDKISWEMACLDDLENPGRKLRAFECALKAFRAKKEKPFCCCSCQIEKNTPPFLRPLLWAYIAVNWQSFGKNKNRHVKIVQMVRMVTSTWWDLRLTYLLTLLKTLRRVSKLSRSTIRWNPGN